MDSYSLGGMDLQYTNSAIAPSKASQPSINEMQIQSTLRNSDQLK